MFVCLFPLQNLLRPCALIVPDFYMITETTLCCHGFQEYKPLARKITFILKMLKNQVNIIMNTTFNT